MAEKTTLFIKKKKTMLKLLLKHSFMYLFTHQIIIIHRMPCNTSKSVLLIITIVRFFTNRLLLPELKDV